MLQTDHSGLQGVVFSDQVSVCAVVGAKCTHSRKGKMWNVLSSRICSSGTSPAPASSQGGVFPISMPVLSIYVAQGIQVGVYPLHTRRTFPISFSLSQDSSRWI